MKTSICRICVCMVLTLGLHDALHAKDDYHYIRIKHPSGITLTDIQTARPSRWNTLDGISEHPGINGCLTREVKDSLLKRINDISSKYPKDSLLTPDLFHIFKPYFIWLRHIDPHYRVCPRLAAPKDEYHTERNVTRDLRRKIRFLPFNLLNVNDTLLIHASLDPMFRKGDIILSINDITSEELLKYSYDDRLVSPLSLMSNYFGACLTGHFTVKVCRSGEQIVLHSDGRPSNRGIEVELSQQAATERNLREYGDVGYISIPEFFPNNSRLIRIIRNSIATYRSKGISKIILDLRNNPGGHGDRFDELLSIFINRDSIPYLKAARAMLTERNVQDYSQPLTEVGHPYSLTGTQLVSSVPLSPKKYIPGIRYYILMNEGTGSIAASFCNVMQYNDAAVLLGEPLLHNALRYGECIRAGRRYPNSSIPALFIESGISSVEYDEYSNSIDGVLYPTLWIRCNAIAYANGEDAMLDKAIEYVRQE